MMEFDQGLGVTVVCAALGAAVFVFHMWQEARWRREDITWREEQKRTAKR